MDSFLEVDIVVSGGSLSAVAAAIAAARVNPGAKVLLIEPTDWLGGQATTQGVSAIDNAWHEPGRSLMLKHRRQYYPADYLDFIEGIKNAPKSAPGEGMAPDGSAWVSREAYDPRTAAWVLDGMVNQYPNITMLMMTVVKQLTTADVRDNYGAGKKIEELTLIQRVPVDGYKPFTLLLSEEILDWYHAEESDQFEKVVHRVRAADPARGLVVIDASELGDVIVLSGGDYTIGRELETEEIAEDGTLPAMDERGTQSFVFTFCMTGAGENDDEAELKLLFDDFDRYYDEQVRGFFSMGPHTWQKIWTYRRLKNTGPTFEFDLVQPDDVTMQNWYPGNDYPYGTMFKNKAECEAESRDWYGGIWPMEIANAEKHAVAWYFYMKNARPTTWDTHYLCCDDELNMMATDHGLSKFPYIRGTRRIVGLDHFRITERYFTDTAAADYEGGTSFRFFDSIGIGNYAVDIHPTILSKGMSPTLEKAAPFYLPYRALGSNNVRNLLASGKTCAQTYVTNAAYRLHPIEWAFGSAAGTAAAMMSREKMTNYEMLEIDNLRRLQENVADNSPIHWAAFDKHQVIERNGDLIVNNRRPCKAGEKVRVEAFHPSAKGGVLYKGDTIAGESSMRANGRIVFQVTVPADEGEWKAVLTTTTGTTDISTER